MFLRRHVPPVNREQAILGCYADLFEYRNQIVIQIVEVLVHRDINLLNVDFRVFMDHKISETDRTGHFFRDFRLEASVFLQQVKQLVGAARYTEALFPNDVSGDIHTILNGHLESEGSDRLKAVASNVVD